MVRLLFFVLVLSVAGGAAACDLLIRGGTVFDGSGTPGIVTNVVVAGDRIAGIGDDAPACARTIDATGHAVAPGFINMLSWATQSLIEDGRGLSDLRQGVTLEVMGEGWSMGPLNDAMREDRLARQGDIRFEIPWTTLGEYLDHLVERGVSVNVASFVGASTVRIHELGEEDRPPTAEELERMRGLVRVAMEEGAMGLGASLIYAPAFYADTDELVALAEVAGEYGGSYITHMRSEGDRLLEGVAETIEIAERADLPAEIYHLKAAGEANWGKLEEVIRTIEAARDRGLAIRTNMYTYTAGATGLDAAMPPWAQAGGHNAWVERLQDPEIRARVVQEMQAPAEGWENLMRAAGSADRLLLVSFKNPDLKHLTGRTLADVAAERGQSPEETAIDLVIEDDSRVGTVYFLMSEENVRRQIALPWMGFGSDGGAPAPEGNFLKSNPHPRAYGNFARLLGRYVRDEGVIELREAIRRLTSLSADRLGIGDERGRLAPGYYADVVIFDPATIRDNATFAEPHQLAEGVRDVFVNGVSALLDGEATDNRPGRVVRGPGYRSR